MLIPEQMADSGFDVFNAFRCLQGFTSFVSLIHTCRDISSAFTVTSTTATFRTEAAYGCLKPDPTTRLRRTYLHLGYSIVLFEHVLGTSHPWHRSLLAILGYRDTRPSLASAWDQTSFLYKKADYAYTKLGRMYFTYPTALKDDEN